jgi:hypothetical protein
MRKESQLTRRMRGRNPDWSHDGSKLVFVGETNGLNQLFILELGDDPEKYTWQKTFVNRENGLLKGSGNKSEKRIVQYLGRNLKQVLVFADGRQIYHPRWSPDDRSILFDTATDYGRDLGEYHINSREFELILNGKEEERYPVFSGQENVIYYSSSRSGIYNIYRWDRNNGYQVPLTNVVGGAMMADVNKQGEIVYSNYDSLGYHIYILSDTGSIDPDNAKYEENYISGLPVKNFDDAAVPERKVSGYKNSFTGMHILPRLLIDYGTVKPGFYMITNDVLDKMSLFTAADINTNLDYDLYGGFEYRQLFPTLFLEAYNLNANIEDTIGIQTGKESQIINQDINFNLTEVQLGARFDFPEGFNWRTAFVLSIYNATIRWFDPFAGIPVTFRYRYLNGRALQVHLQVDRIKLDRFRDISPGGGRYLSVFFSWESNDFLTDFDPTTAIGAEIFERYTYQKWELDWEEYFTNPLVRSHTFSARVRAGYINEPVDDFFHLFAGGFIGMKGYSYYSIEGTRKFITTLTYRLPISRNLNWRFATLYFDKLYFGVFYDYGNAWVEDHPELKDFKRDIGFQLRLECFTNYLFPTKIFWEAVRPLEKAVNGSEVYDPDWRYYFGILFTFDLRERMGGPEHAMRRPSVGKM